MLTTLTGIFASRQYYASSGVSFYLRAAPNNLHWNAGTASVRVRGRRRRSGWRWGRGLLGIIALFAAAREQAQGRAQQTGQDEFLHSLSLVFFSAISTGNNSEPSGEKSCTGCSRKSFVSSAVLTSLTDVWF
jgi:hypothetical protein